MWSQNQGHLQNWLNPFVTIAQNPLDHHQPAPWPHVRQKYPPSAQLSFPTTHLTPTFQQEFSLSWGCKNWLLTHKNCWLSLVCQEVGSLYSWCPHYLCSWFLINSLPSEMPCVWKLFSNPRLNCHPTNICKTKTTHTGIRRPAAQPLPVLHR